MLFFYFRKGVLRMDEIVKNYIDELNDGFPHKSVDSNLARVYEYQKTRLDDEGILLRTRIAPGGYSPNGKFIGSLKDKHCPYCGASLNLLEQDWIVTDCSK